MLLQIINLKQEQMKKQCKLVTLPTEKAGKLVSFNMFSKNKLNYSQKILPIQDEERYQHLYIISDEEIKEGEYMLEISSEGWLVSICKNPIKSSSFEKKIIATTDTLMVYNNGAGINATKPLPQIPESFIKAYLTYSHG